MQENILKILMEIQSRLKAPKSQYNRFGKYAYRSCEDILEAVKPLLIEKGATLVISDDIIEIGGQLFVKAIVTLSANGDSISVSAFAMHAMERTGMDASQITGSSSSYARKYALNGLFLIDDTKDADGANTHGKDVPPQPPQPPQPPANRQPRNAGQNGGQNAGQNGGTRPPDPPPQPPANPIEMLIGWFAEKGVKVQDLENVIGFPINDFGEQDLVFLRDIARVMKRGTTFDEAVEEAARNETAGREVAQ